MAQVESCESAVKAIGVVVMVIAALVMSGCGSVFGVREFEVWDGGPRWEFMEGIDFHIGANGIDHVENQRGVTRGRAQGAAKGSGMSSKQERY